MLEFAALEKTVSQSINLVRPPPYFSTQIFLYFAENEKKKIGMKAEDGSSFVYYFDILYIIVYYMPLTHYFLKQVNVIVLTYNVLSIITILIMTAYIWNNFAWQIFTTCLSLYINFLTIWIGEKFALEK